jgi:ABC-type multidrug transport system fused ATPase/permease subunit
MYKKTKEIISKVLYLSKLTEINKKKIRLTASVILANIVVGMDILIILVFTSFIGASLTIQNDLILKIVDLFINYQILFPLLIIARYTMLFIEQYNVQLLSLQVAEKLRARVMATLFQRGNYSTADSYFYVNTITNHVSFFYRTFANLLNNIIQIIGYSIFLINLNSYSFTIFMTSMLILAYPTKYLLKKAKKYQHRNFNVQKNVNQYIQRIIDNLFLIKILNTFSLELENFKLLLAKGKNAAAKNVVYGSLNSIFPTFLVAFILSILFTFFGFAKFITIEFIGVLLRVFQSLGNMNNSLTGVVNSSVHIEDLYKFETKEVQINPNSRSVDESKHLAVKLENVSFSYLRSSEEIFSNLNLEIQKNAHTIVTGPNGSGKSTLLGIISGLYTPTVGSVKLSSSKLGYVGVTPLIIETSIRENLLYGNSKSISDQQIKDLLTRFNFKSTKINLDEIVSNKTLSSGQMQKISFIRALLNDVGILLLDESTSNLDKESKVLIFDILKKEEVTILNSTHNREDFSYDHHIEIEVKENFRTIRNLS